ISIFFYFFFSSRRRHTRSKRDWSSDVCSSDLISSQPVRTKDITRTRGKVFSGKIRHSCRLRVQISQNADNYKKSNREKDSDHHPLSSIEKLHFTAPPLLIRGSIIP